MFFITVTMRRRLNRNSRVETVNRTSTPGEGEPSRPALRNVSPIEMITSNTHSKYSTNKWPRVRIPVSPPCSPTLPSRTYSQCSTREDTRPATSPSITDSSTSRRSSSKASISSPTLVNSRVRPCPKRRGKHRNRRRRNRRPTFPTNQQSVAVAANACESSAAAVRSPEMIRVIPHSPPQFAPAAGASPGRPNLAYPHQQPTVSCSAAPQSLSNRFHLLKFPSEEAQKLGQ